MYRLCSEPVRCVLLAALLVSAQGAIVITAAATEGPAASSTRTAPSDADLASARCVIGEERFLPADYYYCLASQSYGQQHYDRARKVFTIAAGWASKPAQYVLGMMAFNGDHQPVNRPLALAWFALAAERPNSSFKTAHDAAAAKLTPAERQAAERLLLSMNTIYGDATAAGRAEKRYAQGMAVLSRLDPGGGNYCMEGVATLARPAGSDPSSCPPIQAVMKQLDRTAESVFDGWSGHVTVGPLQQVDGSAGAKKNGG